MEYICEKFKIVNYPYIKRPRDWTHYYLHFHEWII